MRNDEILNIALLGGALWFLYRLSSVQTGLSGVTWAALDYETRAWPRTLTPNLGYMGGVDYLGDGKKVSRAQSGSKKKGREGRREGGQSESAKAATVARAAETTRSAAADIRAAKANVGVGPTQRGVSTGGQVAIFNIPHTKAVPATANAASAAMQGVATRVPVIGALAITAPMALSLALNPAYTRTRQDRY